MTVHRRYFVSEPDGPLDERLAPMSAANREAACRRVRTKKSEGERR